MESEFKYECNICFNEDILEKNIVYLDCLHYTCNNCFYKLKAPTCPFCRAEINIPNEYKNEDDDIFELENDYYIPDNETYNIPIPTIRRNRQQSRRNKIDKKKQRLNLMIESQMFLNIDIPSSQTSRKGNKKYNRTSPTPRSNRYEDILPHPSPSQISRSL
jgi:hypothetical protein